MNLNQVNLSLNFEENVDQDYVQKITENICKRIQLPAGQVSLSFINNEHIQELNNKYRGVNNATDVLTFCINEDDILGDMYISIETVKQNAIENNVSLNDELARVIAHAFAHLLGYNHKTDEDYVLMHDYEDFLLTTYAK